MTVDHTVLGVGYNSYDKTTRLALAVMITYCTIAIVHITYLGLFGISSTAWDSSAELLALAMNSTPTKYLQNTCAGIIGIKTFQTRIRVLARRVDGNQDDHLELVFGDVDQPDAQLARLEVNQKYGKLHID